MEDQFNEGLHHNAANRRTLADYVKPSLKVARPSVIRPAIQADKFTIPPSIITMIQNSVQFGGMPEEDPNSHIALFLEVCDTFKINGVSEDAVKLRLFPFSLHGKARSWLNSLPAGSVTTWEEMAEKFLFRYFPSSKTTQLRKNIYAFLQEDGEFLFEAWERFKELLRKCPHHGLELWQQVQTFYNGLNRPTRQIVDITAGGSLSTKTPEEAFNLLEELAMNNYEWPTTRSTTSTKRPEVNRVDSNTLLATQVEADYQHGGMFNSNEHVNASYGKSLPSFDRRNNPNINQRSFSNILNDETQIQPFQQSISPNADHGWREELEKKLEEMISRFQLIEEHLRHITISLSKQKQGSLQRVMEVNPKEQVKAITMRSNIAAQVDKMSMTSKQAIKEKETKSPDKEKNTRLSPTNTRRSEELVKEYNPPLPCQGSLEKENLVEQYGNILEPYKQLHVNLPFVESLAKKPKYTMFLKDLMNNKEKLEEISTVTMNEVCSAILQNKLPQKITDPGSFTIPCLIGSLSINNALADLGASISLMPYSLFTKLDLGEPKPTRMTIQLADRSLKYPRGVVENMLVKIDRFVFPVDFVILEMDEDENVPLILGRPFLATSRALIDVFDGKLTLRVDDDTVTFNIKNSTRKTQSHHPLYFINTIMLHVGGCKQKICKDTIDTQILGWVNQKINLTNSFIELLKSPLDVMSPTHLKLLGIFERQGTEPMPAIEPHSLKLKELPSHPEYAILDEDSRFPMIIAKDLPIAILDEDSRFPMIIAKDLPIDEKEKNLRVPWKTMDIIGISPSVCMHKILTEEDFKFMKLHQKRHNQKM